MSGSLLKLFPESFFNSQAFWDLKNIEKETVCEIRLGLDQDALLIAVDFSLRFVPQPPPFRHIWGFLKRLGVPFWGSQ